MDNFNLIVKLDNVLGIKELYSFFYISLISFLSPRRKGVSRRFLLFPKKTISARILRGQGSDRGERRNRGRQSMTPTGTLEALIFVRDSSDRISSNPFHLFHTLCPFLLFLFRAARRDSIRNFAHSAPSNKRRERMKLEKKEGQDEIECFGQGIEKSWNK